MTTATQEIQTRDKQVLTDRVESTHPGRTFAPNVDILETDDALTVLADVPGASAEHLTIDLRDNVLTLTAKVDSPERANETQRFREFEYGTFFRQFRLSNAIDQGRIDATLTDGVLRLVLPKAEASRPRRIEIKTG